MKVLLDMLAEVNPGRNQLIQIIYDRHRPL